MGQSSSSSKAVGQSSSSSKAEIDSESSVSEDSESESEETGALWFFKDRFGNWQKYGHRGEWGKANIRSSQLENYYQSDQNAIVRFSSPSYNYKIDMGRMIQTNLETGVERPVRREGLAVVPYKEYKVDPLIKDINISSCAVAGIQGDRLKVTSYGKTYDITILRVREISNIRLLQNYAKAKLQIQTTNGNSNVNEETVFHCTKEENVQSIAENGFLTRPTHREHGHEFGKGAYFSPSLGPPLAFNKENLMIISKILTGISTEGKKQFNNPPHLDEDYKDKGRYDSCFGKIDGEIINVIFNTNQIYPRYVIDFVQN